MPVILAILIPLFAVAFYHASKAWNDYVERKENAAQLQAIRLMEFPPLFMSEFPGDRTVFERRDQFVILFRMADNPYFTEADIPEPKLFSPAMNENFIALPFYQWHLMTAKEHFDAMQALHGKRVKGFKRSGENVMYAYNPDIQYQINNQRQPQQSTVVEW